VDEKLIRALIAAAKAARKNSYSPYSRFKVGAALLAKSGRIYAGANVENASYGLTLCAERVALATAVSAGARKFSAIAVVGKDARFLSPCGACRQMLAEFGTALKVVMRDAKGKIVIKSIEDLLPLSFGPHSL